MNGTSELVRSVLKNSDVPFTRVISKLGVPALFIVIGIAGWQADDFASMSSPSGLITIVVFVVWVAVVLAFYFAYGIKRSAPESVS